MTDKKPISLRERVEAPKQGHFVRAAFAAAQSKTTGKPLDGFLSEQDTVARAIIMREVAGTTRASAAPGTTTSAGFGLEIARDSFRQFLISLSPYSAAARFIALAMPAELRTVNAASYPVRSAGAATPAWVAEGDPIPVRNASFSTVDVGPARKLAAILPWSRELSKRSDADAIFEQMLREDVAAGIDGAFLSDTAASDAAAAGLLNGVTPLTASSGGGKTGLVEDLTALAEAAATGGSGNITFAMAPERAAMLKVIAPELSANLDIAATAALASDRVVAVDAAALLVAVDSAPDIMATNVGAIHMSDAPLPIVSDAPVTADPVRSLWQTASVSLRVLHEIAFSKRRVSAVAYIDGAYWK